MVINVEEGPLTFGRNAVEFPKWLTRGTLEVKLVQVGPKLTQVGFKLGPSCSKLGPKLAQVSPS